MEYNKEFKNKPGRKVTTSSPRDVIRRQQSPEDLKLIEDLQQQIADLRSYFNTSTGGLSPEQVDEEIRKAVKDAVKETKSYYEPLLADSKAKEEALRDKVREFKDRFAEQHTEFKKTLEKELDRVTKELQNAYNSKISSLEDKLKLAEDKVESRSLEIERLKEEKDTAISRILEEQNKKLEDLSKHISMEKLGVDDPDRPKIGDVFVDPLDNNAGSDLETHIIMEDVPTEKKEKIANKVNKLKDLIGSFADKED